MAAKGKDLIMSTGRARILIITPANKSLRPGGHLEEEKTMFDQVEHQSTPEDKSQVRAYVVLGAVVACSVIVAALVWLFGYYGG